MTRSPPATGNSGSHPRSRNQTSRALAELAGGHTHGTAYGEDGFTGHRLGHEVVWTVPYAQFVLPGPESEVAA